ncbi:MAG: hypothetical protein Kow0037_20220 [Calditrichia bacterium]
MGYVFAILTGVFFGLQGFVSKIVGRNMPPQILSWAMFTFSLPVLTSLLIYTGIPQIDWPKFLFGLSISFVVNIIAWHLFFKALQMGDIAHTMPFTAFTPVFLIPVSYFMIGELPNQLGFAGIVLIFIGGFVIHLKSDNLLEPLRALFSHRGTRIMLFVAFIWSFSATGEKIAVLASSQTFYGFAIVFAISLFYSLYFFKQRARLLNIIQMNWKGLIILGVVSGLGFLFQFTALKALLVSYVIAFKRAGVIVSVIMGILFFNEKNALKNTLATLIMVAGVFLLILS